MSKIALKVNNALSLPVSLNILGGVQDGSDQNNADTLTEYNLSTENFLNVDTVIIQSRFVGQPNFLNSSSFIGNLSIEGVAQVLSTLNLGNFLTDGNIIYTYNSDIEFGDLILTSTNVPSGLGIAQAAYLFFVPIGSSLEEYIYPNQISFTSEWLPAIEVLISQTNASLVIDTFGVGCIMPLYTQAYIVGGSVTFNVSSPKAASLQPILSTSAGVTQGYNLNWSAGESNAMLFFPSGDCNEVTSMTIDSLQGNTFLFDQSIFPNLGAWNLFNNRSRVTTSGCFDNLTLLTNVEIFNSVNAIYPPGWTFPGINAPSLTELNLDGPGVVSNQTFQDNTDFNLSSSTNLKRFIIESLVNAVVETPLSSVGPVMIFFIRESEDIILGQAVNTFYSTLAANAVNKFDVGFTNTNVSWQQLGIPIEMNGFQQVRLDDNNLGAFPLIQIMNFFQNTTPTSFEIDLRLNSNQLNTPTIDQILIDFDTMVTVAYTSVVGALSLAGQTPPAPPSALGTAAAVSLVTKGFTITTD